MIYLILILILNLPDNVLCQPEDYGLYISTMEAVDRNNDRQKECLEIFYILKKGEKNIELSPADILRLEAYLYEDKKDEALIYFWRIDNLEGVICGPYIYLPFREGFAYNIYKDKIVPALLKIKIIFKDENEIEAMLRDKLSFLAY